MLYSRSSAIDRTGGRRVQVCDLPVLVTLPFRHAHQRSLASSLVLVNCTELRARKNGPS